MTRRLTRRTELAVAALVIGSLAVLLLLQRPWQSVVISSDLPPFTCGYDAHTKSVVYEVPMRVATRGEVTWQVQVQLYDQRNPSRQPFVSTRLLTFDTHGKVEERTERFSIAVIPGDWDKGFRDCRVTHAVNQPPE